MVRQEHADGVIAGVYVDGFTGDAAAELITDEGEREYGSAVFHERLSVLRDGHQRVVLCYMSKQVTCSDDLRGANEV